MNIGQALFLAKNKLRDSGIESFNLDAMLLLSHLLQQSKEFIIFNPEIELPENQIREFETLISRRQKFEPISHILQNREFYARDFFVSKDVLDPRPDSETLIEYVLKSFQKDDKLDILEVGVGSGCLIITLLIELQNTTGKAVDISKKAIEIATKNSLNHDLGDRLNIIESDLFSNIREGEKFDLIISNPPYIKSEDINNLQKDVKNFEPLTALDGGEDGLDFYRRISKETRRYLRDDGSIIIEIGAHQENEIIEIFQENKFNFIDSAKDIASIIRILHFKAE